MGLRLPVVSVLSLRVDWIDRRFAPRVDILVGEASVNLVSSRGTVESRGDDRMLGVRDGPEPVALLDEPALFESRERRADAPFRDIRQRRTSCPWKLLAGPSVVTAWRTSCAPRTSRGPTNPPVDAASYFPGNA